MSRQSFYMVISDRDKKQFCVKGPMLNDEQINSKVVLAQQDGRNVNCFVSNKNNKQEVIENTLNSAAFVGFEYVEKDVV